MGGRKEGRKEGREEGGKQRRGEKGVEGESRAIALACNIKFVPEFRALLSYSRRWRLKISRAEREER